MAKDDSSKSGNTDTVKRRVGLSGVSPERRKEIAAMGGRASHANGTGHEWTPLEAREAGRRGGKAARKKYAMGLK